MHVPDELQASLTVQYFWSSQSVPKVAFENKQPETSLQPVAILHALVTSLVQSRSKPPQKPAVQTSPSVQFRLSSQGVLSGSACCVQPLVSSHWPTLHASLR